MDFEATAETGVRIHLNPAFRLFSSHLSLAAVLEVLLSRSQNSQ